MKSFFPATCCLASLVISSCSWMNQPIESGDFDPLSKPQSKTTANVESSSSSDYKAGSFIYTAMDNTPFFKKRPEADSSSDKLLKEGVAMKVISSDSNYVKVELDDGSIGYLPVIMVSNQKPMANAVIPSPTEVPLTPILPTTESTSTPLDPALSNPSVNDPSIPEIPVHAENVPQTTSPGITIPALPPTTTSTPQAPTQLDTPKPATPEAP